MIPTLFHKRKYLKESIENTCKSLSRHCNFDARNLKKRTNMMEKVTQMIAMLIKAWKKESVSQIDTPPVPTTPEPKQQSPNNSACLTERVNTFLQTHYDFRYNRLTEETEFRPLSGAKTEFRPIGKRELNTLCMEAHAEGISCWDKDVSRYIYSTQIGEYHPFRLYMDELPPWDGIDRLTPLARRVSALPLWVKGFHTWMLGLAAQWEGKTGVHANSLAPILISAEQGRMKSTFCKSLMPKVLQRYYMDNLKLTSEGQAERLLSEMGLINLDEFDKLSASKMPLLKNLMQASALNIRKAYKRSASALPRIASFIGTSNREDLLVDRTGSRRFLCVSLEHAIDCVTPVEHEQLYAQLKAELLSGERSWFNKEEEQAIQQHNALFYKHIPEEEVFRLCFRFATQEDHPQEVLTLSATQLFERMKSAHPSVMRGMTAYSLSRILPRLGERVHTAKGNVYRVVAC